MQVRNKWSVSDYRSHNALRYIPRKFGLASTRPPKLRRRAGPTGKGAFLTKQGNRRVNVTFYPSSCMCSRLARLFLKTVLLGARGEVGGGVNSSSRDARASRFDPIPSHPQPARGQKSGEDRPRFGLLPYPDTWNNLAGKRQQTLGGEMREKLFVLLHSASLSRLRFS